MSLVLIINLAIKLRQNYMIMNDFLKLGLEFLR